MNTGTIFCLEDKIFKQYGLYILWLALYFANLAVLTVDNTAGPSRDFNVLVNGVSVIYCGVSSANNIYGNKLPSTLLLIAGPMHQYLYWLLFVYFGGSTNVLTNTPVGSMNWVTTIVVGVFTFDMFVKTWFVTLKTKNYIDYTKSINDNTN